MDKKTIFVLTIKGETELKNDTRDLSEDVKRTLALIDGKSMIVKLMKRAAPSLRTELFSMLGELVRSGFIQYLDKARNIPKMTTPKTLAATDRVEAEAEDLDFTKNSKGITSAVHQHTSQVLTSEAVKAKTQAEAKIKAEAARLKAMQEEAAAKAKLEAALAKSEAEAKARAEAEATRLKAVQEEIAAKVKLEAALAKSEAEAKARAEARIRAEAEAVRIIATDGEGHERGALAASFDESGKLAGIPAGFEFLWGQKPTYSAPSNILSPENSADHPQPISLNVQTEESMPRIDALDAALKTLQSSSPRIEASAFISSDGLMIASVFAQDMNETRTDGMKSTILSLATRSGTELLRGEVSEVIDRGDHGIAVMVSAGRNVLLLVLATEATPLGLLLFDMRETVKAVKVILLTEIFQ